MSELPTLEALAEEHIQRALAVHGSVAKAAKALGVGRSTLYRWKTGRRSGAPYRQTLTIQERRAIRLKALLEARETWRNCQNVGAFTRWLSEQIAELGGDGV
jgi:DNA-binding transcriptional regulator YdaS (Cro superfamily)